MVSAISTKDLMRGMLLVVSIFAVEEVVDFSIAEITLSKGIIRT